MHLILEFPSVYRYFKDYIEASGGFLELKKALDWSVWYAVKWWKEVAKGPRNNAFVQALYMSLRHHGYVDEEGRLKKEPDRPEMPKGLYAQEWVKMHETFDALGASNIASDLVDRNTLDMLYSDIQVQGWHKIMVKTFLKATQADGYRKFLEPLSGEGHVAALLYDMAKPEIYVGYEPRRDLINLAKAVAPGATFTAASTACALSGEFDVALLIEKLHWMADPAAELECIRKRLTKNGAVIVAQPVVESMPGYIAIHAALGARHVFTWKHVENILSLAGLTLEKRLIKAMPFYGAVWRA